jgi:ABC-type antimicrobial peptide transport system permease subunit
LLAGVIGESLLTAGAGVVVGAAAGLSFAYLFIAAAYPRGAFEFQTVNFAAAVVLLLVTAAVVTMAPALAIARTAPAQALRLVD